MALNLIWSSIRVRNSQLRSCYRYQACALGTATHLRFSHFGRNYSYSSNNSAPEPEDHDRSQEIRIRRLKKICSSVLFVGTLIVVLFARRRKQQELETNLQDCVRLPSDEDFKGSYKEFYRCGDGATKGRGCVFPFQIVKDGTLRAVKTFKVLPDDVIVASFPKTGTTWVQEIVYLLMNDLNVKKASDSVLETRFPYLEYPYPGLNTVTNQKSPRFIKTHLPLNFLPNNVLAAKVIYITRNPKDTVVSYYHFSRMLAFSTYKGNFREFLQKFKKDEVPYAPFFEHLNSFLRQKANPNLLIVTYEELTRNPAEVIAKIANFLEKPLTDAEVELLVSHTSFSQMSRNPSVNYSHWDEFGIRNAGEATFMRKGKVGDWQNYFSPQDNQEFDAWIRANNTQNFNFEYLL